jgi:hypothetical protein
VAGTVAVIEQPLTAGPLRVRNSVGATVKLSVNRYGRNIAYATVSSFVASPCFEAD